MARKGFAVLSVPAIALIAIITLTGCSGSGGGSGAHESFATPEAAVDALVAALEAHDRERSATLFGPGSEDLISTGDPVQDGSDRDAFLDAYRAKHSLVEDGADKRTLIVGEQDWPLPVPIVQRGGRWYFDGKAGTDEIAFRRIGRNELGAIAVAHGFVDAQKEYASTGHDGDPAGIYALKLMSDEGRQNGLYWPTAGDEPPSPAGPFVGDAAAEGYRAVQGMAYHGYRYRMLYRQGSNARGGAREYFTNGVLTKGFALVAWPSDPGNSGVMTFIVNQDDVVYQKDLGEETDAVVAAMTSFDPDNTWKAVPE
ncbi:MAG: DUF2950 domain-containing protein [Candidatus Eiseniibacteriota bacterium]